ncbi:MAG TPA: PIN domain-containing protein [Streptosporangiaceae bacterium]|nr:PIN domain-containing protein [Streptosporangiaceae bacterium]
MSVPYVYDAGALIAIDGNDRRMWAIHHLAMEEGREVFVPAIVVGQAWRNGSRQALLGRLLRTCEVEPIMVETAKAAGVLCGKARSSDVVDATVIVTALAHRAIIFSSDDGHLAKLAAATDARPAPVIKHV